MARAELRGQEPKVPRRREGGAGLVEASHGDAVEERGCNRCELTVREMPANVVKGGQ